MTEPIRIVEGEPTRPERAKPARVWLEPCKCGKKHKWTMGVCPECRVHEIPVPVSERCCTWDNACDGCYAYRDHLR